MTNEESAVVNKEYVVVACLEGRRMNEEALLAAVQ